MKTMPTFSLFDLKEEKQQEFLQVLNENAKYLWHRYRYYDELRHHKWLGWYYKRVSNYYWKEYSKYENMIARIKDEQELFYAIQYE